MYFSAFIFLSVLETSLANLPDPDNCCQSVKIKKSESAYLNGEVFKLDNAREYLVSDLGSIWGDPERITYEDGEWQVQQNWPFGWTIIFSSNSTTKTCPENVEVWTYHTYNGDYLSVSDMKIVCYKPFYKKYWYVILIACLLGVVVVVCFFLCCCCLCGKKKKSENAVVEVSTVLDKNNHQDPDNH